MRGGSCAYFPVTGRTAVARRSDPWDDGDDLGEHVAQVSLRILPSRQSRGNSLVIINGAARAIGGAKRAYFSPMSNLTSDRTAKSVIGKKCP
jgi:hypothetical protein